MVAFTVTLDHVAFTVTDWFVVVVPALAVKFAELCPLLMVTVAGTVRTALLSDSATLVLLAAALDRDTVQVDDAPALIDAGEQLNEVSLVAVASVKVAVRVVPL